jgi:hypothetical protein
VDHKRNILKQIREIRGKVGPEVLARAERAATTANAHRTDMPYPGHAAVALFLQNHDPTGAMKAAVRHRAQKEDAVRGAIIDNSLSEDQRPARTATIKEEHVSVSRQTAAAPVRDAKRAGYPCAGAKRDGESDGRVVRVRTLDMLIPGLGRKK